MYYSNLPRSTEIFKNRFYRIQDSQKIINIYPEITERKECKTLPKDIYKNIKI